MNSQKTTTHRFILAGMRINDSFQGCPVCGFHLQPRQAMKPICPKCYSEMHIYTVGPEDQDTIERHNRLMAEAHAKLAENRSEYS